MRKVSTGLAALSLIALVTACSGQSQALSGGSTENSAVNVASQNQTVSPMTVSNTSDTNSTGDVSITVSSVSSQQDAVKLVQQMFVQYPVSDPNRTVSYDHTIQVNNQSVYVIHVYDQMTDHQASIAWIGVRSDGMVQDEINNGPFENPNDFMKNFVSH